MDTVTQPSTLLQSVEVYRPSADGAELHCSQGGEQGLPKLTSQDTDHPVGKAWQSRTPIVMQGQTGPEGPCTTLALPAFRQDVCRGVVALRLSVTEDSQGAIEIWRRNERNELAVHDGWYRQLDRFAEITKCVKFPRRAGLPGKVWADRFPRVLASLGTAQNFVRAAGAKAEGLSTGLGIPFMQNALDLESVLLLLSSAKTPLVKAVEVWSRAPGENELKIVSADYGPYLDLGPESRRRRLQLGEGIAGHVFRDHAPWMTTDLMGAEFPRGEKFVEYGFTLGVGFPVFVGEQLTACVSLLA